MRPITVTIAEETFELFLENNASAQAFSELLPLELEMVDVNGNEKFYLLADHLPSQERCSCLIKAGDLLLCQTNELTFFYDDSKTCFKYTYLGHVKDSQNFRKAMTGKIVTVIFEEKQDSLDCFMKLLLIFAIMFEKRNDGWATYDKNETS